mmetsp:Transcript_43555/g.102651  ORF Transcript_43555/g.102651 Transcript_43555/m.102651 type:complete len:327 (-) Transcript_43555:36-1016(-)
MGASFAALRFYTHGKKHFTETGYLENAESFTPGVLEGADLKGKTYAVTGANSGIGYEVARYLAAHKGKVLMLCRSRARAQVARDKIVADTQNNDVEIVECDVSLAEDVRRVAAQLKSKLRTLDCLVCNAGALADERTATKEGHEVTFAAHLLCGTYLLTMQLMPLLKAAKDPRVVVVSSGGMYTTAYDQARAVDPEVSFDGQLAYANAKRGQVLLVERWAADAELAPVKFVSCHPGWTDTPGVDSAYGSSKSWLEPLRTLWQGSDGICWLCVAHGAELVSGEFYLDRMPQEKYLDWGISYILHASTTNTPEEVDEMMQTLAQLSAR